MPEVTQIEIIEDFTDRARCDEGFLRLKRYVAANRHADGSRSREYPIDVIDRPSLDAVAVCLWARTGRGVEVLTRRSLAITDFAAGRLVQLFDRVRPLPSSYWIVTTPSSSELPLVQRFRAWLLEEVRRPL